MDIYGLSGGFPKEELYSLISQIESSSRSVSANILEGWSNRNMKMFLNGILKVLWIMSGDTKWLNFAVDGEYVDPDTYNYV